MSEDASASAAMPEKQQTPDAFAQMGELLEAAVNGLCAATAWPLEGTAQEARCAEAAEVREAAAEARRSEAKRSNTSAGAKARRQSC